MFVLQRSVEEAASSSSKHLDLGQTNPSSDDNDRANPHASERIDRPNESKGRPRMTDDRDY